MARLFAAGAKPSRTPKFQATEMLCRFLLVAQLLPAVSGAELGGEKAFFTTPQMTPGISHRQNVCDRYYKFIGPEAGDRELRQGLSGMQLNVVVGAYQGAYFNYDPETGIDSEYPGIAAVVLDELAKRANFTWRNSFGTYQDPSPNTTWDEMLWWGIDSYDLMIDWWSQSLDRMDSGAVFIKGWHDSSLMLVSKEKEEEDKEQINIWNWLKPYDFQVWTATILTIIVSAIVYQILEWFADDRQDRAMWEWIQENMYLSTINFTQAYEYQPKTFSGRLFGISMAIWALVMTATYTANLASLLVDRRPAPPGPQTLAEVAVLGYKVCVWEGTFPDNYLKENFEEAIRIQKPTLPALYQGIQDGECDYMITSVASWKKRKAIEEYNPHCDLYWVGDDRKIKDVPAGFVSKADSGSFCTGFIRDVLNIHMHDMIDDGKLQEIWDQEYDKTQTIDCNTYQSADRSGGVGRRLGRSHNEDQQQSAAQPSSSADLYQQDPERSLRIQRLLKAGGKGATGGAVAIAAASSSSEDQRRLTLEQMIGTFVFHWGLMMVALFLAGGNALYAKYAKRQAKSFTVTPQTSMEVSSSHVRVPGSTSMTVEEESSREEVQDLRKQMADMQLQLQKFEQVMLEQQQATLASQQALQEKVSQLLLEQSAGKGTLNQKSTEGKSLVCGDIPAYGWENGA